MKKILLLGSGELGKEFVISAQRKGRISLLATRMPERLPCKWQMNVRYSACSMEMLWNV